MPKKKPNPDPFAADVGPPRTERLDCDPADGCGSLHTVEADEDAHPMDIERFGPYAVVRMANALAQAVERFDGLQGW